jgi:hypothetical protein
VAKQMYKKTKKTINFFRDKKDVNFIVWICPLLKPLLLIEGTFIYKEEDRINGIYFLESGKAAYVLPRYHSFPYVHINQGDSFGIIDIVFRTLSQTDETEEPVVLHRKFSVIAVERLVMLVLEI